MLRVGDKVRVKNTDMSGSIVRVGERGLYALNIETEHSPFDIPVFGYWELEKIGGSENE